MSKIDPIKLANTFSSLVKLSYQEFYKSQRNNLFVGLLGGTSAYTTQVGSILQKFVLEEKKAGNTTIEEVNITGYFVMPVVEGDVAATMAGFNVIVEWDYVLVTPNDQKEWLSNFFDSKVKPAILAKYRGKITSTEVSKLLAASNIPGGVDNSPEESCVSNPWKFVQKYFQM